MDIKERIEAVADRIKNDKDLMKKFKEDPTRTVESVLEVDLPDEVIDKVVAGIKLKLAGADLTGGIDGMKGLFGK